MDHAGQPAVLPLRPLTVGELLDAAVALLRSHAGVLMPVAAVLALAEQLALAPLRSAADFEYLPKGSFGAFWLLLCVGAGTEMAIIALLGGLTSRAAGADVLGGRATARQLLRPAGGRFGTVALIALLAGGFVLAISLIGGPAWIIGYGLLGLAVPALVIDRIGPGRALLRGMALACRTGLRAIRVRFVGYLAWLAIRIALGLGAGAALDTIGLDRWAVPVHAAVWLTVNSIAYPTLACLDAVLHLETRMRTEGLDILLSRARHNGTPGPAILAAKP